MADLSRQGKGRIEKSQNLASDVLKAEGVEGKGISRTEMPGGRRDSKKGQIEKLNTGPTEKSKKGIVDLVDLSGEEPQSEVERLIQQKRLLKKQSELG